MAWDPLFIILLLVGTEPIHERRQTSWWQKINLFGLICCVAQLTLTVFGFFEESARREATEHFKNNILRLTILYKQIFTVVQPFLYLFAKILRIRCLELFHERISRFDNLISVTSSRLPVSFKQAVERIRKVSARLKLTSAFLLAIGEVLNVTIGVFYTIRTSDTPLQVKIFYFYQITVLNFVGTAFHIVIKLTEVKMRLQLLVDMEKGILRDIVMAELEKSQISVMFK